MRNINRDIVVIWKVPISTIFLIKRRFLRWKHSLVNNDNNSFTLIIGTWDLGF